MDRTKILIKIIRRVIRDAGLEDSLAAAGVEGAIAVEEAASRGDLEARRYRAHHAADVSQRSWAYEVVRYLQGWGSYTVALDAALALARTTAGDKAERDAVRAGASFGDAYLARRAAAEAVTLESLGV